MKPFLFAEIIVNVVLVILAAFGVYHLTEPHGEGPKPVIVSETKTVFRYIHDAPPADYDGLLAWYNAPLDISGEIRDRDLRVEASDGYKHAEKSFRIETPLPRHTISGGLAFIASPTPTVGTWIDYKYRIRGPVVLCGGVTVARSVVEVRAGVGYQFFN